MYSLSFPVTLPDDRAFFVDDRAEVPPLCGNLRFSCGRHSRGFPQILFVEGLPDLVSAKSFAAELACALRCASLQLGHSFQPSDQEPVIADMKFYDGQFPTIFETTLKAQSAECAAHVLMSEHLINLAREVDRTISSGRTSRLMCAPELSVAIKLYSEMEFAGGETAKFVVLLSALEVLIPKSRGGKRGQVVKLVRDTFRASGRSDAKAIGKQIDTLYEARNDLVHEARPVTSGQVNELSEIVRDTLRALIDQI